jgi:hypothetical protein
MSQPVRVTSLVPLLLLCALAAPPAFGLAQRTFVASNGNDADPCSLAMPCRSFSAAIAQAIAGGEVIATDSAGYGTVTINKPIQIIVPPGVHAAIFAATGDAVTVAAGVTDVVVLRGLYISSTSAATGIRVTGIGRLQLENVVVNGFVDAVKMTTAGKLSIRDSTFRNNSGWGVMVLPASGAAEVSVERSTFDSNAYGMTVYGAQPFVSIKDSSAHGHSQAAFTLYPSVVPQVGAMTIEGCTIVDNNYGVIATANAGAANSTSIYVSASTIARNATGVLDNAGGGGAFAAVISRGNNTLEQNTAGNTFSLTYLPK